MILRIFLLLTLSVSLISAGESSKCWVPGANHQDCEFPIENLPYGVFRKAGTTEPFRIGVAIGDYILDLKETVKAKLLNSLGYETKQAIRQSSLNDLMSLDQSELRTLRGALIALLSTTGESLNESFKNRILFPRNRAEMTLPATIGDYTDFYTSVNHALNIGKMFRPDNPLFPNFKHLPVAYHGRASSIVVSGVGIDRPFGQYPIQDGDPPSYLPTAKLDYEMELGAFVGIGNEIGDLIPIDEAEKHLFGVVILNDWSARDVQKWEYRPLGPFNGKNFSSSISPWVVTFEALKPYRSKGPLRGDDDPAVLPYLRSEKDLALNIIVEVLLLTQEMRERNEEPVLISQSNFSEQYWSFDQMLTHHSSSGCNMRPGDLIGSGTISGSDPGTEGCLLELTRGGKVPVRLPDGTKRSFLEDGDEVVMRAYAHKEGLPKIGFGECRTRILGLNQNP